MFGVTAYRVAASNAERAEQLFQVFDQLDEAREWAEKLCKDDRVRDVRVWKLYAAPKMVSHLQWEEFNNDKRL